MKNRRRVRMSRMQLGTGRYIVLSFDIDAESSAPNRLSPNEREVVKLALQGYSNEEIARLRSRSHRTIANQLASAYRKLGVKSRAGLAAVLAS